MQPPGQNAGVADRDGALRQEQERRLEHVLGELDVSARRPRHPPDQRPVPANQLGERRLIPVSEALFRYEGETLATCAVVSYGDRTYFQDEDGSYVRVRGTAASIEWEPGHQDDR